MLQPFGPWRPVVDPRAYVHESAVLIGRVEIGAEASIWPHVTLRGDDGPIVVGAQTSIQDGSVVHMTEGLSCTTIGARVTVGHRVVLHGCTLHDECLIGIGAVVLDNAIVESGAVVGAGTLVPPGKVVPANTLVVGNPFRVVRTCTTADTLLVTNGWRAYVARTREYLEARGGASAPYAGSSA